MIEDYDDDNDDDEQFLQRDAMPKHGLWHHAVTLRCLSLCHVRGFYQNE